MRTTSRSFEFKASRCVATAITMIALSACGPSSDVANLKAQTEELKKELIAVTGERNSLRARVEELSNTPTMLLAKVSAPVAEGKLNDAEAALLQLTDKFPQAQESIEAKKIVDALRIKLDKQQEEARRLEALGFKALKIAASLDTGDVKASVGVPNISKQFTFDRYDESYHYRDADRDHKFVVLGLSATAAKGMNNPQLPGFALYWADGKQLRKIDQFDLQFVRWEDYATYLGNYHDSHNDFAKSPTIPFTIGVHGAVEDLAKRPLYVVATTKGCLERNFERFRNPPVYYSGVCTDLKSELTIESFASERGNLVVVRRID